MSTMIDRMPLVREHDLVIARQKARQIAGMLGFDRQDQARIATAVSEIARNAIRYAHDGSIAYEVEGERAPQILLVRIADRGPGIANLDEILEGRYKSTTGMEELFDAIVDLVRDRQRKVRPTPDQRTAS